MRFVTIAAALALAPCTAFAGTMGTIPIDPNGGVSGSFSAPGTQTWRLYLKQNRYYALWGWGGEQVGVVVRAAGGRSLAAFQMHTESQPNGAAFRAPYTGSYSVEATCAAANADNCLGGYAIAAGRDCPGDPSTRCGIALGATLNNLQMRFVEDHDWFRAGLQAGVSYRATIAADPSDCGYGARVTIRDASGTPRAQGDWYSCDATPAVTFAAPASGTYYLDVSSGSDNPLATYSLTLSR